eukprot:TRINITY_DN51779_c0_g2_i1.p2 TRINITY_DN51779_c0_g2~~TRINITY_DN51779_c0_g2_i1.p2  ORF type:complete len:133 (+),score=25.66 TRINITY_DN51779_c0_g2_i1:152-550(+)
MRSSSRSARGFDRTPRGGVFAAVFALASFFSFMASTPAFLYSETPLCYAISSAVASYLATIGTCFGTDSPHAYVYMFVAAVAGACLYLLIGEYLRGLQFFLIPAVVAAAATIRRGDQPGLVSVEELKLLEEP